MAQISGLVKILSSMCHCQMKVNGYLVGFALDLASNSGDMYAAVPTKVFVLGSKISRSNEILTEVKLWRKTNFACPFQYRRIQNQRA